MTSEETAFHCKYHSYKRDAPLYEFVDIPRLTTRAKEVAVPNNYSRFTYSKDVTPAEQDEIKKLVVQAYITTFADVEDHPRIRLFAMEKKWYIDLEMFETPLERWNSDLKWKLFNRAMMEFQDRGGLVPQNYITMSIEAPNDSLDVSEICKKVDEMLVEASITDVWLEYENLSSGWIAPTCQIFFLVALNMPEKEQSKLMIDTYIRQLIQKQPVWISIPEIEDIRLHFNNAPKSCSTCRSKAESPHWTKECDQFLCKGCGNRGFRKDHETCSKEVVASAPIGTFSCGPINGPPVRTMHKSSPNGGQWNSPPSSD